MNIPYFSAEAIAQALPMRKAIDVMRAAFVALHEGRVVMPVRLGMPTPDGLSLFMPAYLNTGDTRALGQKVVHVFQGNRALGLPTIHALVTMFDAQTGVPTALLEGTYLTALRTGAVTGLATEIMSNPHSRVLTVFGAGGQAAHQIEAVCAVRPIQEVRVLSRGPSAAALVSRLQVGDASRNYSASTAVQAALHDADVVVCTTTSTTPLFPAAWVRAGTHVNAIGAYTPKMREVGPDLLNVAVVTTDNREAALHEAGDFLIPIGEGLWSGDHIVADLGELAAGARRVAYAPGQITFFKSNGLAVEDIAAASAVLAA